MGLEWDIGLDLEMTIWTTDNGQEFGVRLVWILFGGIVGISDFLSTVYSLLLNYPVVGVRPHRLDLVHTYMMDGWTDGRMDGRILTLCCLRSKV